MSEARRAAEALDAALANVTTASSAARQHRCRSARGTLPQHIADLGELVFATETIHGIVTGTAAIAKSFADNVRAHYLHGSTPSGDPWPDTVRQAAADVDQSLSALRAYLARVPVSASHTALGVLHEFVRTTHRGTGRTS